MKIAFLGDSITEGCGASSAEKNYVNTVGRKLKAEVINYGVGGTRIARSKEISDNPVYDLDFLFRSKDMVKDADVVFVFGGTNDYGHGKAPIGEKDDVTPYTFYGAVKCLARYLKDTYGAEKTVFILPARRFDDDKPRCEGGQALSAYADIINRVCKEYGIKVLDLFNDGFPVPQTDAGDEYTTDGLHPNDRGHEFIAEKICRFIEERL